MIDIGVITGSGIYEMPVESEAHFVKTRFGEAEVAVFELGRWRIGAISRHGKGHYRLPNTIPHRANLAALEQLGARAILATTSVGAVDAVLGRPVIFDDLYFPENRLPNGEPCTIFTEPGEPERGHLIASEPFSPKLRRKMKHAADSLGIEAEVGGTYAHANGPRFETASEIRALEALSVSAVSQTCGPEAVLAGELEMSYALAGFAVNHATGLSEPEPKDELDRLLALSTRVLPRLVLRTVEMLEEEDFAFDHGYVYRVEGGIGKASG
ncbi:MAG: MTAP family purine nucleoside phosphorylase [Rubrobacteraceae bacterium]